LFVNGICWNLTCSFSLS